MSFAYILTLGLKKMYLKQKYVFKIIGILSYRRRLADLFGFTVTLSFE